MRIAVSGSIATDHLMSFPGRFAEQLLPDSLAHLSVSFLVDDLDVRRGGVGANICLGLGRLGGTPVLLGAVGDDFGEYGEWLRSAGVDTSHVVVSTTSRTARFVCTTDSDENQIASFYPGAMSEAGDADLDAVGDLDLLLVGANDPTAMTAHTRWAREHGVPVVADPSQQLASLDGATVRELVDGAEMLFSNAYEADLVEHKTGWDAAEVLRRVGTRVTTLGKDGCRIARDGEPAATVAAVPARAVADPTGVGDAFRAGFLAARARGLEPTRCAEAGSLVATWCVETVGPQEYIVDAADARSRLTEAYGDGSASDIVAALF